MIRVLASSPASQTSIDFHFRQVKFRDFIACLFSASCKCCSERRRVTFSRTFRIDTYSKESYPGGLLIFPILNSIETTCCPGRGFDLRSYSSNENRPLRVCYNLKTWYFCKNRSTPVIPAGSAIICIQIYLLLYPLVSFRLCAIAYAGTCHKSRSASKDEASAADSAFTGISDSDSCFCTSCSPKAFSSGNL